LEGRLSDSSLASWQVGCLLLLFFVFLQYLLDAVPAYAFSRLGLDRGLLTVALWILPVGAAYLASRYSSKYGWLLGLSYSLMLPVFAVVIHSVFIALGVNVDFRGPAGLTVVFQVYFVLGGLASIVGTLVGRIQISRKNSRDDRR
jgi:hypothetical protein